MRKRNDEISISKGIAIILMVMGHAGVPYPLDSFIYSFHMPLFFIFSGYFLKVPDIILHDKFVVKRLKSLWYPYVIWTIIGIILHNVFSYFIFYDNTYSNVEIFQRLVHSFLFGGHDGYLFPGFWFLKALFCASIFTYFTLFLTKKFHLSEYILFGMFFVSINILMYVGIENNTIRATLYGGFFILVGFTIKKIEKNLEWNIFILLCIQLLSVYINPNADMLGYSKDTIISYTLFAITGTLMIYNISKIIKPNIIRKILIYVGDNTMPILILHGIVFKIINCFIVETFNYSSCKYDTIALHFNGSWIIYTLIAILFSLGMHKLYKEFVNYIKLHFYK